jgi:hypothetical protein
MVPISFCNFSDSLLFHRIVGYVPSHSSGVSVHSFRGSLPEERFVSGGEKRLDNRLFSTNPLSSVSRPDMERGGKYEKPKEDRQLLRMQV